MSQQLDLKAKGLYTNPNPIGSMPAGSWEIAKNVVIDQAHKMFCIFPHIGLPQ